MCTTDEIWLYLYWTVIILWFYWCGGSYRDNRVPRQHVPVRAEAFRSIQNHHGPRPVRGQENGRGVPADTFFLCKAKGRDMELGPEIARLHSWRGLCDENSCTWNIFIDNWA